MRDPNKRYVTVVQVLEALNVTERTVRRWMASDPPRLHWIEDSSGHKYIDMADVERIKAERPELVRSLESERMARVEGDVQELQREVKDLKGQVSALLTLIEASGSSLADHPRRVRAAASSESGAEARGYPPGTIRLVKFAEKHQLAVSEIKTRHLLQEVEVSIYERKDAVRNGHEWWITPEQHRALIDYYQQHGLPCGSCDLCSSVPLALSV